MKPRKDNTAGFWINNKMMKINDDGGNDDHGLLWRKAMMMMRKPWRHWLERREPMLNQMVRHLRQPQKSLSFSSLSWPGSTTSTTKVAWLYFKTQNKGKLLCHYFQIWTSFQTIGQMLKTLTGFVQLCRDMLVTNMKLMRREKYVLPRNSFFWLIWRSGKSIGKSMERNPKIGLKKYFPRIHFFKMTPSNFNAVFEAVAVNSSGKKTSPVWSEHIYEGYKCFSLWFCDLKGTF